MTTRRVATALTILVASATTLHAADTLVGVSIYSKSASAQIKLGEKIIDLGLIYDLAVEAGVARITMTTTMPGCPATDYLREAVQAAALSVPGISATTLNMLRSASWNEFRTSISIVTAWPWPASRARRL